MARSGNGGKGITTAYSHQGLTNFSPSRNETLKGVKTGTVDTVNGPVSTGDLGRVLMHEHVFVLTPEIQMNYPTFDEVTQVASAVARLRELKASGIDTIVDLTVIGIGRYIPRIQRVNAEANINILVATGLYTFRDVPQYFYYRAPQAKFDEPDVMVDMFVRDIQEGIGDTGVKAAILKCATDKAGVTHGVERVLRAVAVAHRATGVPISTHTHAGSRRGLEQQHIFESEGVDLSRVVIGHSGDTTDIEYLEELMARGSYIGMDRFGNDVVLPFEARVQTVATLCQRGHAGQMVLSHDAACYSDWLPDSLVDTVPRWHYLHIGTDVVPALKQRGVTDDQIDQLLIHNPKRIFDHPQAAY